MGQNLRKQDWEKRLADYIDNQRNMPFVWGKNDCVIFAGKAANEILERNYTKDLKKYVGKYTDKTHKKALSDFGDTVESVFDAYFTRYENKAFAKRGDIVTVLFKGERACGVIDTGGRSVVCKTYNGLRHIPVSFIDTAWNIEEGL